LLTLALITLFVSTVVPLVSAQEKVQSRDRERAQEMLRRIKDQLKKNYYDPNFRGMDLEARFKTADEKIKNATSLGQIFGTIAQVLIELDDSHTVFLPPARAYTTDYGWTMQIIGDRCYVSSVGKGSDAEAKGVKPGDEVLEAGGYQIDRTNLWKFLYLYNALRPQQYIHVVLRSPNAEPRELNLLAKQKDGKKIINLTNYNEWMDLVRKSQTEASLGRDVYATFGDHELMIWKMNEFDLTDVQVDDAMASSKG
jgi:C-terminal processing protease CtpA/Prc